MDKESVIYADSRFLLICFIDEALTYSKVIQIYTFISYYYPLWFPMIGSRTLFLSILYLTACLSGSQTPIPPTPSATTRLFCVSVSLFLCCKFICHTTDSMTP